jgi:hypothetical protein
MTSLNDDRDPFEGLTYPDGTVGKYLDTPPNDSIQRKLSFLVAEISLTEIGLAALAMVPIDPFARFREFFGPLAALGILTLIASIILIVYQRLTGSPVINPIDVTTKAILGVMVQMPKTGVTRRTSLQQAGMRHRYIRGSHHMAFEVWSKSVAFKQADFTGLMPYELGAFDYDVLDNGRVCIYLNEKTATRVRESRYERGRRCQR